MILKYFYSYIHDTLKYWELIIQYLTSLLTGNSSDIVIFSNFLAILENHPIWFLIATLIILLLCASLLACIAVHISEIYDEHQKQLKRYLSIDELKKDKIKSANFIMERSEELNKR